MLAVLFIAIKWEISVLKTALALASPAMTYIILHEQIDLIILAGICLSYEFYPLLALGKPQVALGLLFGIPRSYWLRSAILLFFFLLSPFFFLVFG